ncbi:MAG: hypothetical protein R3245_02980, partial [Kiloniellales bacterium]|nr:hypothetical protein [Kiloniellales bacterium]
MSSSMATAHQDNGIVRSSGRQDLLYFALCLVVFAVGFTSVYAPVINATIISFYELTFVVSYLVVCKPVGMFSIPFKEHPIVCWLLVLWVVIVTLSLVFSPFGVISESIGILRYLQTLAHVLFFVGLRDFIIRYD